MSGGLPRLRLPVTPQNLSIAGAFAAACARTLDASETTVEAVGLVVTEIATLFEQGGATIIIETDVRAGARALVLSVEGDSVSPGESEALVVSASRIGAVIEADRWVIPIGESGQ